MCVVLLVLALCAATVYASARAARRLAVAQWSGWRVSRVVAFAAAPWGVLWLALYRQRSVHVQIHNIGMAIVWPLLLILLFVLVPLGALVVAVTWGAARVRFRRAV